MSEPQAPQEQENPAEKFSLSSDNWEDTESTVIPYSQEDIEEPPKDPEEPEETPPEEAEEVEAYADPEPVITAEDPGEYTPGDYSFEVQIKGKTIKVTSADQADELADEHADDLDAKTLGKLIRGGLKIESQSERDLKEWQEKKDKYDAQVSANNERQEALIALAAEFNYLVSKGLLPEVEDKYKNANWEDPEVAKQPGVVEQVELLRYMGKENEARAKLGVKPFGSVIDAYNSLQAEKSKTKAVEEKKAIAESRKAASAKIVGTSTAPVPAMAPKGVAVGRVIDFNRDPSIWEN